MTRSTVKDNIIYRIYAVNDNIICLIYLIHITYMYMYHIMYSKKEKRVEFFVWVLFTRVTNFFHNFVLLIVVPTNINRLILFIVCLCILNTHAHILFTHKLENMITCVWNRLTFSSVVHVHVHVCCSPFSILFDGKGSH